MVASQAPTHSTMVTIPPKPYNRRGVIWSQTACLIFWTLLCVLSWPQLSHGSSSVHVAHQPHDGLTTSLLRRDDYACSADKPCKNGACCGSGGYCGYGDTYCGAGCLSNCGATAECGKDAKIPGQTCPLNTCCSEFGFVSCCP